MHRPLVAIACLLLVATVATAQDSLPAGPGRETLAARCLTCHEADIIVQQKLSRAGWVRSVDKMVRWGATIEPTEREGMLDYLAAHFTPKPVPAHIVATAGAEVIYKRACLTCHEDDLIEAQRLTRTGWTRSVEKMIRWGAVVPDTDKDALIEYLAARFPPR